MIRITCLWLLALNFCASSFTFASDANRWKDDNRLVWQVLSSKVRKSFERASTGCAEIGQRLATRDEMLEALDAGLATPSINKAFGAWVGAQEYLWATSAGEAYVITPNGKESKSHDANERHATLCVTGATSGTFETLLIGKWKPARPQPEYDAVVEFFANRDLEFRIIGKTINQVIKGRYALAGSSLNLTLYASSGELKDTVKLISVTSREFVGVGSNGKSETMLRVK